MSECCDGCRWHKTRILIAGEMVEEDENGCSNPMIDSIWCLTMGRPNIRGIYYDAKKMIIQEVAPHGI